MNDYPHSDSRIPNHERLIMAYYAYKTVRDLLPPHIIEAQGPDYEGDGNYDGDQWYAAEAYILELRDQRDDLVAVMEQLACLGNVVAQVALAKYAPARGAESAPSPVDSFNDLA